VNLSEIIPSHKASIDRLLAVRKAAYEADLEILTQLAADVFTNSHGLIIAPLQGVLTSKDKWNVTGKCKWSDDPEDKDTFDIRAHWPFIVSEDPRMRVNFTTGTLELAGIREEHCPLTAQEILISIARKVYVA
jgi:hypothetical protein